MRQETGRVAVEAVLEPHPFATYLPEMNSATWGAFLSDVKANGIRDCIVLHDGLILDGRHRWRAAKELGIECPTTAFLGNDPLAFVMSANLHRRHLSTSERAVIAAKLATGTHGGDRKSDEIKRPKGHLILTNVDAARLLNVSDRSVRRAKLELAAQSQSLPAWNRMPAEQRAQQIAQLAGAGNNVDQIAAELKIGKIQVRRLIRDLELTPPSGTYDRRRLIKTNVVAEETVNSLVGLAQGIETIRGGNFAVISPDQAAAMLADAQSALRSINWLVHQLRERLK